MLQYNSLPLLHHTLLPTYAPGKPFPPPHPTHSLLGSCTAAYSEASGQLKFPVWNLIKSGAPVSRSGVAGTSGEVSS